MTFKGNQIHYLEAGEANPGAVILLHGNVGDAVFHWRAVIRELALDYHVIAPDLPGFGGSSALATSTFDTMLDWMVDEQGMAELEPEQRETILDYLAPPRARAHSYQRGRVA